MQFVHMLPERIADQPEKQNAGSERGALHPAQPELTFQRDFKKCLGVVFERSRLNDGFFQILGGFQGAVALPGAGLLRAVGLQTFGAGRDAAKKRVGNFGYVVEFQRDEKKVASVEDIKRAKPRPNITWLDRLVSIRVPSPRNLTEPKIEITVSKSPFRVSSPWAFASMMLRRS
jgi:hypothetical protein